MSPRSLPKTRDHGVAARFRGAANPALRVCRSPCRSLCRFLCRFLCRSRRHGFVSTLDRMSWTASRQSLPKDAGRVRRVIADVRSVNNIERGYFQGAKPSAAHLRNLAAIREHLQRDGRTLAQGALCWLLAKSDRNVPVPGARTDRQAAENAGAVAFSPLPNHVMAEIKTLMNRPPEGPPPARQRARSL